MWRRFSCGELTDDEEDLADADPHLDARPVRVLWLLWRPVDYACKVWRCLRRRVEAWMLLDAAVSVLLLPLHAMQLVARNAQATAMLWVTLETAVELLAAVVMAGVAIFLASVLLLQDALDARRKQAELRTLAEGEAWQEQVAEPVVLESPTPPRTPRL